MLNPELVKLLRKYWYIFVLVAGVIAGLVFAAFYYKVDPTELLSKYGYVVILIWTFLEGETVVIIAGMFSDKFGLDPWLIALCAFSGSFISDQVMFSLGKYKGESVLHYFPSLARNVDRAAGLFKKYDTALILGFRFVYGVRNVTPILLGISGVSHKKFLALNVIGAGVWALAFSFGGYYSGKAFLHVMEQVGHGLLYGILAALVIGGAIWYFRARASVKHVRDIAEHGNHLPGVEQAEKDAQNPEEKE